MGCDNCIHRKVCHKIAERGEVVINMLLNTFPAINVETVRAATLYTMASRCSHYRTEEKAVSITIVS